MSDQCDTSRVKGFLRLDTQYGTFANSYICPGFPESIDRSSDDLRVGRYACTRRRNPSDIGLEQYPFPAGRRKIHLCQCRVSVAIGAVPASNMNWRAD
jgi:hypothetical protein